MLVAVLHLFGDVEAHYHKKYYLKALKGQRAHNSNRALIVLPFDENGK